MPKSIRRRLFFARFASRTPLADLRRVATIGLVLTALALPLGCGDDSATSGAADTPAHTAPATSEHSHPDASAAVATVSNNRTNPSSKAAKGEKAARHPNERPVPSFSGRTLAGTNLAMRDLLGTRLVLFFFNPEVETSTPVARAVNTLSGQAGANNFKVVGVSVGSSSSKLRDFAKAQDLAFPVIDDSAGTITGQLRLTAPVTLLGVDADGYVTFGVAHFPPDGDIEAVALERLRKEMRVGGDSGDADGALFAYPKAPDLDVMAMSNGKILATSELKGRAAIVIFFLHTCPHCHHALEAIKGILESLPDDQEPRLVAISVQNAPSAIRKSLADLNLDYFDPYLDPSGDAATRWGVTGGVPVVTVVDKDGSIIHRSEGWNEKRDGGMLRMQAARAAGARVPMLLDPKGYSGNDACGTCHAQEYATWQYTAHSTAFDTLVTHEADRRKDCIGCHVVGYEEPGGYDFFRRPPHLEDVGCESCHGRGGPHLSPGFVPKATEGPHAGKPDYAQVCSTCHTPKHSLGFDFEIFHPRVSHKEIAALSNDERSVLLGGAGPNRSLLPTSADYVGSAACQSCHTKEFETWSKSPHGHAVATLETKGEAGNGECLQCHTTAYGKPGGFPTGAPVAEHPDLARVGCESCHGPGGDHIGESAARVGTILSLGDKCDSCVILKVCGTCHDDTNDPGFPFEVEQRIDDQRHGTIESAATRAGESAFHVPAHDATNPEAARSLAAAHDRMLLQHAFEHAPKPGPQS